MQENIETNHNNNTTQGLQQKLLSSTRYSVVDQIISLKSSLDKQKMHKRRSEERLAQIKKKVLQLQNQDKLSNFQAKRFQKKLEKLQDSQNLVSFMAHLKGRNIKEREEDLLIKRSFCYQFKEQLNMKKEHSLDYFETRKKERVKRMKEQNFNYYLEKQRRSQQQLESRRKSKQKVKQEQAIGKQRLKRYSEFKLAQAEFNYQLKRGKQLVKQKQLAKELTEYRKQKEEEQEIFRKTQILSKQVKKVESLYLTSSD